MIGRLTLFCALFAVCQATVCCVDSSDDDSSYHRLAERKVDPQDNSPRPPFKCVRPGIAPFFGGDIRLPSTKRRIYELQDENLRQKLGSMNFLFENIFKGEFDVSLSTEKREAEIEYIIYAKRHGEIFSKKLGYFKPCYFDYGSPSYFLLFGPTASYLHAAYPPGLGIVREYAAFAMSEAVGGEFFVPTTIPMHIDGIGDGLMKMIPKARNTTHIGNAPCFVYQNRLLFNLITMAPFYGHMVKGVPSTASRKARKETDDAEYTFFTHNAFVLPNTQQVLNTTMLSFRSLRVPCMREAFSERSLRLIRSLRVDIFDDVLQSLHFPRHVQFYVQLAIDTIIDCVLNSHMTPSQLVQFMYTAQPIAFIPSILAETESIYLADYPGGMWSEIRSFRSIALQKIQTNRTECDDYSRSTETEYRHLLFSFF